MRTQKLGLGLFSVRHDLERDFAGTLEAVGAIGYDGVEFFGPYSRPADEVAEALEEAGLVCCGWHTPWELVQPDRLAETIAYNKTIGNTAIVIPSLPESCTASLDAWRATAARFNDLAARLAGEGMTIGYHNHHTEFAPMEGQVPYYVFFDNTVDAVVMQLDNGNAMQGGGDMLEIIRRYPGRAKTVHLKAYSKANGINTMIGQDDVPWTDFLEVCRAVGGTEWFIAEYEAANGPAPLDGVRMYHQALSQM